MECGPTTYKTIRSLVDSETRKNIKYSELIDLLTSHYNAKPSSIVQRFKFYNRNRSKEELIASYLAALRALAEYCEYGESLNMMLRDKLVCGVNHEGIQRRLLAEKDLIYDKALEIALTMEAAAKDTKDLLATSNSSTAELHYTGTGRGNVKNRSGRATQPNYRQQQDSQPKPNSTKGRANPTCCRCGGSHLASECRFCNTECWRCKKIGHIAKVCRSKSTAPRPTHYTQDFEVSQMEDTSYDLFMIQEADKTREPMTQFHNE